MLHPCTGQISCLRLPGTPLKFCTQNPSKAKLSGMAFEELDEGSVELAILSPLARVSLPSLGTILPVADLLLRSLSLPPDLSLDVLRASRRDCHCHAETLAASTPTTFSHLNCLSRNAADGCSSGFLLKPCSEAWRLEAAGRPKS